MSNWRRYFHGFVVLPFLIAAIGILPIAVTMAIVRGKAEKSPADYLDTIERSQGQAPWDANARWRAAYQLSMHVTGDEGVHMNAQLADHMARVFKSESVMAGDPKVRHFLALAMGRTRYAAFFEPLLQALNDADDSASRAVFVRALGYQGDERAVSHVTSLLTHKDTLIRHEAVQALGNIGSLSSIDSLKAMLEDPALDIRWDAAIGLAKMKDASGKDILLSLLDECYYTAFPNVSQDARDWAMEVAIRTSILLRDPDLNAAIEGLASSRNLKVREAALAAIQGFSTQAEEGSA
ncbi:MAG: HEAT repeat domain-containing protein [Kiritimatiellia bacterium]|nr:HEAT repeat domain-containing protein [Kiritimatiellia bacterium]MDP6630426.1 HEAT repeat domain-containing protein [Kiritimatiellia bacterium]MDP7024275.1 HEAT repeat domain-containing protein [Kiritimatiellia bacterium]